MKAEADMKKALLESKRKEKAQKKLEQKNSKKSSKKKKTSKSPSKTTEDGEMDVSDSDSDTNSKSNDDHTKTTTTTEDGEETTNDANSHPIPVATANEENPIHHVSHARTRVPTHPPYPEYQRRGQTQRGLRPNQDQRSRTSFRRPHMQESRNRREQTRG